MESQPPTNKNLFTRLGPWPFVLLVLLFAGFIRLRLLEMPLERDEGEYAYAGQLILQGIPPYEMAYNMKLPGTYYAYALGMAIFHQTVAGVHLTVTVANALTIIFVFLLARKLFGITAGMVACASYGVMSVSPLVLGMAAHANQFVVLFAVPATLLLLKWEENRENRTLFFSGLIFGLAFLMKQQGIFFCLFGCLFLIGRAVADKSLFSSAFIKTGAIFALGMLLPFGIFCLACFVAGDFARFWFWTFQYAHWYATALPVSDGLKYLGDHLQRTERVSLGFWLVAVAALPLAWLNKNFRRPICFAIAFWICSFLGTAVGYYFRAHYFILSLPAFAILVGAGISSMQRILLVQQFRNISQLPLILFAAILGWAIFCQARFFFQLSPVQIVNDLYRFNPVEESLAAGNYLREHSDQNARVAVIGSEPEIYFYARRHSATGYIYTYPLMEPQPAALAMQRDMISEIETNRPEFLVFVPHELSWLSDSYSPREIFDWFGRYSKTFYDETAAAGFNAHGDLIVLQDGDLEKTNLISGRPVEIFRRKPDAQAAPAKSN